MPFKMTQIATLLTALLASASLMAAQTPKHNTAHKKGLNRYIVQLQDAPVALYQGALSGFPATSAKALKRQDMGSEAVKKYQGYLKQRQAQIQQKAASLGVDEPHAQFQHAINALVLTLNAKQLAALGKEPGIKSIEQVTLDPLHTDSGPRWIGAETLWNGPLGESPYQGEGIVIGILDTGINTDHPSFADIGADGYNHINPYGSGVYKGDCRTKPGLCNDKLVGVYSYPAITGQYDDYAPGTPRDGEDHNGHGSHVAATAAGNVLNNTPLLDVEGNPTPGFVFPHMSGVAPHANIISYQVCYPGEDDAVGFSGCPTDLVIRAIDQAIQDQVDVINHSIGAGSESPWTGAKGVAFLSAREAGIMVANSAGNDGPDAGTLSSNAAAPWVMTVAAYSHDRSYSSKTIGSFSGGVNPPQTITGESKTGAITADIVYAGDFANPNDPTGDSGQCIQPFPAGTFNGQIVVCDRGDIARVDKGRHVKAGGAGGFVLTNISGGDSNLVADNHVLPAIQISAQDGNALKSWLASGSDHRATISASQVQSNPELANITAGFSSRGPNFDLLDVISPSIAAPGVEIWAAYADDQPEGFKEVSDPADFAFLDGTSMASPHVAGAAALLKQARPNWTIAEIQSALMLTANQQTFKEDGSTASDYFDMGSGMVDVGKAVQSGLVMNISMAQYRAANPATGGDPSALNMPSIAQSQCFGTCRWTRTFKATQSGNWQLSAQNDSGLDFNISPSSFNLSVGQQQTVTISLDTNNATPDQWHFANIRLSGASQTLNMPVAVIPTGGKLPQQVVIEAKRNADSYQIQGLQTLSTDNLELEVFGLGASINETGELAEDSSGDDVFDDLNDGVATHLFTVPAGSKRLITEITETTSTDLDIWLGRDSNGDGIAQENELLASSAESTAFEKIDLLAPQAGSYWLLVQNWQAGNSGSDSYTLARTLVNSRSQNMAAQGPSQVSHHQPFDVLMHWDQALSFGDVRYAVLELTDNQSRFGQIKVDLVRVENDVRLSSDKTGRIAAGEQARFFVNVDANNSHQNRQYELVVTLPQGLSLVADSASPGSIVDGQQIKWSLLQRANDSSNAQFTLSAVADESLSAGPLQVTLSSSITDNPFTGEEVSQLQTDLQVEGAPEVFINGSKQATLSGTEGSRLTLPGEVSDPNNDNLQLVWQQTAGPTVSLSDTQSARPSITLPSVTADTDLSFRLTATDTADLSDSATVTVTVLNQTTSTPVNNGGGGGGSLSWWWLLLLALGVRRRPLR
ncbi:S8 family serine peptidase [Bowmanella denitrificans]|uniref:S8 family serine peptidase n=1 Tax=Bowmanella denitrificans TaxID=366582 RepID=UPI00155886CF|nr:S8 family serine peptidase [Bowmanella denitrificans]